MSTAPVFDDALSHFREVTVMIEMSVLTFMDSTGLKAVLAALKRLNPGCIILMA